MHLLAPLAGRAPAAAPPLLAERLGHWIGWTDAIALSAALADDAPVPSAPPGRVPSPAAARREFVRVREMLAAAATRDGVLADTPGRSPSTEFADYRRHHATQQRAMEQAIAKLRSQLRGALAAGSPALAKLAAIDARLEMALATQERAWLSSVPPRLEKRFAALVPAASAPAGEPVPEPGEDVGIARGLAAFRDELRAILLAELDHRLQPLEGLLDALRQGTPPAVTAAGPST